MTIKQRRQYFDAKENWDVTDDRFEVIYGIRINVLYFREHQIFEEENNQLVYDFDAKKEIPKWCHGFYFIMEDGAMKKVGMTEITELMKKWDKEDRH